MSVRLVRLPLAATVAVDVLAWAALSALVGYVGHRLPASRFDHDTRLSRLRRIEDEGGLYRRLGIRRWKDRLPEAGAVFAGGFSKRALGRHDGETLARYATETRRAEWVHRTLMALGPLFVLWNPPALALAMIGYGVVGNAPCIAVQRYNRGRLAAIAGRAARRTGNGPSSE